MDLMRSMVDWANMHLQEDVRRSFNRYSIGTVTCELGQVVDLSGGGLRTQTRYRCLAEVGESYWVNLSLGEATIRLQVQAAWHRRVSLLHHQTGFFFKKLNTEDQCLLQKMIIACGTPVQTDDKSIAAIAARFEMPDYFAMLDLEPDATQQQIKQAYRQACKQSHPDLHDGQVAQAMLKQAQKAYRVLSDPNLRETVRRSVQKRHAA